MDTSASTLMEKFRPWLPLAGLVAVPLYGIPFGLYGLRAVRPKLVRDFLGGAIALGALSLLGLAVTGAKGTVAQAKGLRAKGTGAEGTSRWQLPATEGLLDEGVAASAVSGH